MTNFFIPYSLAEIFLLRRNSLILVMVMEIQKWFLYQRPYTRFSSMFD